MHCEFLVNAVYKPLSFCLIDNFIFMSHLNLCLTYEGVLIIPQPDLLPDVVGQNR